MGHHSPWRVELRSVSEILRRYCQALTAMEVQIRSTAELSQRGIGWTSEEKPTTEGTTIFLPSVIQSAETVSGNFEAYKLFATHQAGHLEYGTFRFAFERESCLFKDFRPTLLRIVGPRNEAFTDFERFFDLFRNRRLAADVFTIVEDARVDFHLMKEYAGIRRLYLEAQKKSLAERPKPTDLTLRKALLEILIQISIGSRGCVSLPCPVTYWLKIAGSILRRVRTADATVEDSAEATVRIYCILHQVPNLASSAYAPDWWENCDLNEPLDVDDDGLTSMLRDFFAGGENGAEDDAGPHYQSPSHIGFRGELKPELSQTLLKLSVEEREGGEDAEATSTQEALRQLAGKSAEIESEQKASLSPASFARNLISESRKAYLPGEVMRRQQRRPRSINGQRKVRATNLTEDFYYDEWDYLDKDYKLQWCRLKQRFLEEGSDDFFAETVKQYSELVCAVKKEFEHLKVDRFRRMKRLYDGDDLDFDSVVDSLVEKKVGAHFSERVYWRRKKLERDVCVAFLLDMSASTYERINSGNGSLTPIGASPIGTWTGKRIIDLEKEAIIVLIEALESIGDPYGIYGFSGHSRHNVEFTIIKAIAEDFSSAIKRRVASINPVRGTRMGPAIRHLGAILEQQECRTRLLILISDGRPQDYDYADHHGIDEWRVHSLSPNRYSLAKEPAPEQIRKEYAIYDTRMALLETRQKGITPFCLTIDEAAQDYLRVMCGDTGYEVLDDIYALPRRLPSLYRRLTARV